MFTVTMIAVMSLLVATGSPATTTTSVASQQSKCTDLGPFHSIYSQGVINLKVNHTANSQQGQKKQQIICIGESLCSESSNSSCRITTATCILQETLSLNMFDCVFMDADGVVVPVAGYAVEYEQSPDLSECILNDSYHVWYTLDFVKRDGVLIALVLGLGLGALAIVGLLMLCCCVCCTARKKPDEERLIYTPTPAVFY